MSDLTALREAKRKERRLMTKAARDEAALGLFEQFRKIPFLNECKKIAVYLSHDGEIDPKYIIQYCWQQQINVYLPVLNDKDKIMRFAHYEKHTAFTLNRFYIPEPLTSDVILVSDIDLVLLPLVAFDKKGHRLGMGLGFYDATLRNVTRSHLIGLGYSFQCVDSLSFHEHDVSLQGIVTESSYDEILVV